VLPHKHGVRAKPVGVGTVWGMTHTPSPQPENLTFLEAIGWQLAERLTPSMRQDLTDAFLLITSMDFAAPYTLPNNPEMEQQNEDQV
jgi:hypothetical protein